MIGINRRAAVGALVGLIGLAGCHLTGGKLGDIGEGHGRVDRTFAAPLGRSTRAMIDALDELDVHPKGLSVRAMDSVSDIGKPGWASETNAEFFPDDLAFHELFDEHRLNIKGGTEPVPFNPVLVTYTGETADGRLVSVMVRAQPPDASQTLIMTRIGRSGDEPGSRKLLDRIAERMPGTAVTAPALKAAPPAATGPASAAGAPAAPAELPALPAESARAGG